MGMSTACQIRDDYDLRISVSGFRQILSAEPYMRLKRMRRVPAMTMKHKARRSEWANTHINWTQIRWDNRVWSDGKRFMLDAPEGQVYYWADMRNRERIFTKRGIGGGNVMVWGAL